MLQKYEDTVHYDGRDGDVLQTTGLFIFQKLPDVECQKVARYYVLLLQIAEKSIREPVSFYEVRQPKIKYKAVKK